MWPIPRLVSNRTFSGNQARRLTAGHSADNVVGATLRHLRPKNRSREARYAEEPICSKVSYCPCPQSGEHSSYTLPTGNGTYGVFGGISSAALTISSTNFLNSASPVEGMIMVSRRPPTSSVIRRKRPRGFSLSEKTKFFRSIWISPLLSVSSTTCGLGCALYFGAP
jgi:hypothetical protein